ncbi:hypothetical protein WJX79_006079 [Trebouxia sp. C0005]
MTLQSFPGEAIDLCDVAIKSLLRSLCRCTCFDSNQPAYSSTNKATSAVGVDDAPSPPPFTSFNYKAGDRWPTIGAEGTEHDTFRRDRLESNTVKASFAVAQQALDRLTEHNWSSTADKILSVGWGTDEELAELAYMVVMKGLHSPHIIESCGEMAVTIMYSLPPDVMGRWRSPFFDTIQQAFETLLKSDTVPDGLVSPVEVTAKMSAMIDFLGHFFVCNIVTERILHACLQDLLRQPSDLRVEAAAHLLHITEPVIEHNLHAITGQPSGLQGRLYLRHYYDRIERWCLAGQMDAVVCHWIMDDVVRPRRIWEQQQMKTVVPVTACSAKYGRAAAPRAAPICPSETLAAGRAVSEHSHGAPAEVARAATTPGHLPAAHGGAVANGPVGVQPQETVIEESVPEELTAKKGSAVNLVPQDMCVMEVVPTVAKVKGTFGKGRAAQISKGRKREQPSSPGTPSPSSMKATLQQPTGEADTHAAAREWSMGDFACGRRRPSAVSASSTSSQHVSDTCPASLIGKTTQNAAQPAVSSSALSVELLLTQDRQDFALSIQHLVSSNDDAHMLGCLLTTSWHKLRGASWRPVVPSDVARLHLASAQERVTAAREGLQRVFRKAGSIDPGVYNHTDSPQLGPATNPRHRLPFKLHYSNRGYQMLLKQGWEEGKGLGHGAKGRADPHIPTHQCGRDAHLGLGCMRYKDILTGKAAEDEIRDAIFGLCSGPTAIFTMGALCEATAQFLTSVPQDSRAPPVEGLTWIGGLLGGLIAKDALTLQQANASFINTAAATTGQGHVPASQTGHRQHVMRAAVMALAEHISPAELQRQLKAAGLPSQCMPAKAQPQKQQIRPAVARVVGGSWAQVAAG